MYAHASAEGDEGREREHCRAREIAVEIKEILRE